MTERWKKIESLFHAAMEQQPPARAVFLRERCGGDIQLLDEVSRLVASHNSDDGFLEPPKTPLGIDVTAEQAQASWVGRRIGQFRLEEPIATGGMGTVWLAQRADDAFEQRVAVKLMNWGVLSDECRRRFHQERQTLAQLEHPYITRLIDGGATDDGLPYLVMEYVEGQPIDQYFSEHKSSLEERLQVFRKVCEAVQFAHNNLVVHRDLKPSNILVTADGTPKLVDFGISKLLDVTSGNAAGDMTVTLMRGMTPNYASPEQIRAEAITTATDVYSLGVILYELLSGRHPYPVKNRSAYEIQRIICESDPVPPSVAWRKDGDQMGKQTNEASVCRVPRSDLDNILLKAMQKIPERRYATVQDLSEDLRRYVVGLPVSARKDTLGYRATKFVRRNTLGVVAVLAIILLVAGGVWGVLWQADRTRVERDNAVAAQRGAEAVTTFLGDTLFSASPSRKGGDVSLLEVLREASGRIGPELDGYPMAQASVQHALGRTLAVLWLNKEAEPHLQKALTTYRQHYGNDNLKVADCLYELGKIMAFQGKPNSIGMLEEALAIRKRLLGYQSELVAKSMVRLADALWRSGDPLDQDRSEKVFQEAYDVYLVAVDEGDPAFAWWTFLFSRLRASQDRLNEAIELAEQSKIMFLASSGETDPDYVFLPDHLGWLYTRAGRYDEARESFREHINLSRRVYGDMWAVNGFTKLVNVERRLGDHESVLRTSRNGFALQFRVLADQFPRYATEFSTLAESLEKYQDKSEVPGEPYLSVLRALRTHRIYSGMRVAGIAFDLGQASYATGAYSDAVALANESIVIRAERMPNDHCPDSHRVMGRSLLALGDAVSAKPYLVRSLREYQRRVGRRNPKTIEAIRWMVKLYEQLDQPKKAEVYRRQLPTNAVTAATIGT